MQRDPDEAAFIVAVGRRVAEARKERGWSQSRLAAAMGIEPTTLSRLETGQRPLALPLVFRAARRLGVSPGVLVDVSSTGLPPPSDEERLVNLWRNLRPSAQGALMAIALELAGGSKSGRDP